MTRSRWLPVSASLAALLIAHWAAGCGPHVPAHAANRPVAPPPPPPPPPPPVPKPVGTPVAAIAALLEKTHPDLVLALSQLGERAAGAAGAPARSPERAEAFARALDGGRVLAELTVRMAAEPGADEVRAWLDSADGQAFTAARLHAVEVRRTRHDLSGASLPRRDVCRRIITALGDGRLHGAIEYSATTQAFFGPGLGTASKGAGELHKRIIAEGPWILDRASDLSVSTEGWAVESLASVASFWESPPARDWIAALDRHLTAIVDERIAEAGAAAPSP